MDQIENTEKPVKEFDVIILGGGIAGMTAAIFAARANLRVAILEEGACGGLANWTYRIENFPSYKSINGMELMDRVLEQVEHLGVTVDQAVEIEKLSLSQNLKRVETFDTVYTSNAVILATGRQPIRLDFDDECEKIHYCSVCDGFTYAGKKVLVVGGGNSGFDESLYLLSLGISEIILVEMMDHCLADESTQTKLKENVNVEIRVSTKVSGVKMDGGKCLVSLKNLQTEDSDHIRVDGIFVFIGQKANTGLFSGIIDLDRYGYIVVEEGQKTNIPGVFAAGDVVQKQYHYLTTAMADGTVAAISAEQYLRDHRS